MYKYIFYFTTICLFLFSGCSSTSTIYSANITSNTTNTHEERTFNTMNLYINHQQFTIALEQTVSTQALLELLQQDDITISMHDYAGFEKVGNLGFDLPTKNIQTTTNPGDIVVYQGNQIVVFYGTNSWSYTRIGHIDDVDRLRESLGDSDVTIRLSLQ